MKKLLVALFLITQVPITAQDYKFGKVSKEELEEKFHPLDSTAEAAYLYKYRRTYFEYVQGDGGFKVITNVHIRIKVYTKEGFSKATQYAGYYKPDSGKDEMVTSIKGYTFNIEKGRIKKEKLTKKGIFDEKRSKYRSVKKMTMPAIKEGCIIELKYKLVSPYRSIDDLQFQYDIPVKKLDYKIEIPEYYVFSKKTKGYYFINPIESSKNALITLRSKNREGYLVVGALVNTTYESEQVNYITKTSKFDADNIPALKDDEPFVTSIDNYRSGMKYELSSVKWPNTPVKYFSNTWEDVSKQIYKSASFGSELEKSNYYKDDLEKILATAKTSSEKIAMIFQFVKNRVKWNGFNGIYTGKGVKKAYKEREGNVADINLMLTSMLRSAGLDAAPVLVSTRANGIPLFPTIDGFNYVISVVKLSTGGAVLLDATELYCAPNVLPRRALNWNGRIIAKDGNSSWVELTSSKLASEENNVSVRILDDMMTSGIYRTKFKNLSALTYRKNKNHLTEEALITAIEETDEIEIEGFRLSNKNAISKPVTRTIKFISEDLIENINGKLYLEPLLFLTQHKNPFKLNKRKFPVDFATPWRDKNTISIKIPEGYKVESIPENLAIGLPNNLGVFKYQIVETSGAINTTCLLQFNSAIITPQYYEILKAFYGELVKKQSEKIVLVKI